MFEKLNEFYEKNKVSALNFNCKNYFSCRSGSENFSEAKEADIGTKYESDESPRLLFVSSDRGSGYDAPESRTMKALQEDSEILWGDGDSGHPPKGKEKTWHWYRTHELALEILRNFVPNLRCLELGSNPYSLREVRRYFAHINCVKCCVNIPGNKEAPNKLFENCNKFIPGEVKILKPDILISQGKRAEKSIENGIKSKDFHLIEEETKGFILKPSKRKFLCRAMVIQFENQAVLWIPMYHPNFREGFNAQRRNLIFREHGASQYYLDIILNFFKKYTPFQKLLD